MLVTLDSSPVVRLNRAVAVAERDGPSSGLKEVDDIAGLDGYPWFHATRGELMLRLGRQSDAAAAFDRALSTNAARDTPLARHLLDRRATALG